MANIVYIATSLDGYIAKKDGDINWLHEIDNPNGDDFGYSEFVKTIDALVMGRNTYEKVLSFGGDWPYPKKVFVLSNSLKEVDPSLSDKAEIISGDLKEVVSSLANKGFNNLYIDGGATIQNFLKEDLIDEIHITRVPIILGDGIPLFKSQNFDIKLQHLRTKSFDNGLVQSKYRMIK
jgi:dihydrofolate reductase